MSKFGTRLIAGIQEAIDNPETMRVIEIADPAAIRRGMKLSQDKFAHLFGLPVATLRDWEHKRRTPDTAANNYLLVIKYAPETVTKALAR